MQLTQRVQVLKQHLMKKKKSIKVDGNNFHSKEECNRKQSLTPSVHQFLTSSAILINMLINSLIDLIVSDNCKVQAEIKSNTANLLLVQNIIIA